MVVADTPMHKVSATMTELIRKLKDNKVERIAFERGVTQDELVALMLKPVAARRQGRATPRRICRRAHIRVGRLKSDDDKKQDGVASDIAAIRQMYSNAVTAAEARGTTQRKPRACPTRPRRSRRSKGSPTP